MVLRTGRIFLSRRVLINGSILQGSKIIDSQLDSEFRKELNLDPSPLRFTSGAPHSKKPTKEYLFGIRIFAACSKKDPVTLRLLLNPKGLGQ
ncbi:hypothetical protein TNCV_3044511 [Trichonephila clavipes]|nr:hypothetical protein TNCV_3044511 [Trichonephila clavipes]